MSSTVFVLGAGASKQGGAPLMAEFLDVAQNLWRTDEVKEAEHSYSKVFEAIGALQAVHSKSQLDIDNVESVFATFEMAKTLSTFPGIEVPQIQNLIDSMKSVIVSTIEKTLVFPVSNGTVFPPSPYNEFVDLAHKLRTEANPKHTVSIITFNYDLACDYAFYFNNIGIDYALDESGKQNAIPLLKLHGSFNWAFCSEIGKVVPWNLSEYFKTHKWNLWPETKRLMLSIGSELANFKFNEKDVDREPAIVPPTWNKTDYHQTISNVWARAARELREAENIFVIGYSLPESDAFFRYLYALGTVGPTPLKRFRVYNPDVSGVVEKRFEDMLGPGAQQKFGYHDMKFWESINDIRGTFL